MRVLLVTLLLAGGCSFELDPLPPLGAVDGSGDRPPPPTDFGAAELGGIRDAAEDGGRGDLANGDLRLAADLGGPLDLAVAPDLVRPLDLTALPDLALPPFVPSHVAPGLLGAGREDLVVTSRIDTSALTVDGSPPPPGTGFVADGGLAVLTVRHLTVPGGRSVRVVGSRPLVIVASQGIQIDGLLDGSGRGVEAGAGGAPSGGGGGAGLAGGGSPRDRGGSGAGHGGKGGGAGVVTGGWGCGYTGAQSGGPAYGDPRLTTLLGGSGGGVGSIGGLGCPQGSQNVGGAGGGAIQLTAAVAIRLGGGVHVGGGGGRGGCKHPGQQDSGSGGGGGSGGAILLEAPTVVVAGVLAANGGGGGGGAHQTAGAPGSDGLPSASPAPGGVAGVDERGREVTSQRGGSGGTTGDGARSPDSDDCGNGGGGGGATGRISIRSRGAASLGGSVVSPPARLDENL